MEPKKTRYMSLDEVPAQIKEKLAKFITNIGGDTFVITHLPSEVTGGALARYSRASTGMQLTIINEFLDENGDPSQEKGSQLMDRVLNAYGDDSVGELEGVHVGMENISQILTKTVEDRRIGGSPIEQSTRYVKYDIKDKNGKWRYIRPKELENTPLKQLYEQVNDRAFEVYSETVKRLNDYFRRKLPEDSFEIEVERDGKKVKARKVELQSEDEMRAFRNAYSFTVRCAALDVGRCVLPSSTLTQLGVFGNGRFFTYLITTLKSGELEEERIKGFELEAELKKVIPTFVKRNLSDPAIAQKNQRMRLLAKEIFKDMKPAAQFVLLVDKSDLLTETIASALFPFTNLSLQQIQKHVQSMPESEKLRILDTYIGNRPARRSRTGRGLEAGYPITFDLVGGFAEYRDLERHRMMTQQRQLLTTELGFIMPAEVIEVGLQKEVEEVVALIEELNQKMRDANLLVAAQYATLFNHRVRFMMGMNLREFQHLTELRTQPAGHFSYRSMCMEMARALEKQYPWTKMACKFVDFSDPDNKISRANEQARIAGKNITTGTDGSTDLE